MISASRKTRRCRPRAPARLACLAFASLAFAGCGAGSSTRTVASLSGHAATAGASSTALTVAQSDRDMVSFARCMRSHGVQMSDPFHRPGHSGLSIDLPTRDAVTQAAYARCEHFLAPIVQAKQANHSHDTPAVLAALTRYARCMRAHDISMLDPTPQGDLSLGNVPGIVAQFGRYSPQFRSADWVCRRLLPASVHDDGTGP
jgi:hypothetical protein